jgi:hypothetical protein
VENHANRGMRSKLEDRGKPCLYLGRATNHSHDVGRFLSLETNCIILSRDFTWLNQTYQQFKNIRETNVVDTSTNVTTTSTISDADEGEIVNLPINTNDIEVGNENEIENQVNPVVNEATDVNQVQVSDRLTRELRRLDINPSDVDPFEHRHLRSGRVPEIIPDNLEVVPDTAKVLIDLETYQWLFQDFGLSVIDIESLNPSQYKDVFSIPRNFNEAWNHVDPFQRKMWREAIMKEFDKMDSYKVYKIVKKSTIPRGRKCVKHKWVFDIKRNGVFRARLVACGYSQVPGVDFKESFSPVIHDATFRLMIIIEMILKLRSKIMDIETAFLNGDLEEEIYMEAPDGLDCESDECVLLLKSIYGLVQSARQFYLKLRMILLSLGMKQSVADPCLFVKQDTNGILIVAVYVDDCYIVGHEKCIENFISDIKSKGLKVKIEDKPSDYLSCEIVFNDDKSCAWLGQPHLIKRMEKTFGELVKGNYKYQTPGTPGYNLVRPTSESEKLSVEQQKIYRSGVGTLLQFVKHSRPDINNPVRELSKSMDCASEASFKEMKRVIKFVLDTRQYGLKLQPSLLGDDKEWSITVYSDSDWAGDKETRRSISGYIIFVMNCPILWRSKQQDSVTLSSTEAEYVALSEAAKEIKFVYQVMVSLGIPVKLPIIVKVDNVGAIFMSENATATNRTRHVDARYHFVREFIEDDFIKIIFVTTGKNHADPFTKNVKGDIYEELVYQYLISKYQIDLREGVRDTVSSTDRD